MMSQMILRRQAQWLGCAAAVVVGQAVVLFAADPRPLAGAGIVVAAIMAWLMLRGSRFAWAVVAIGVAAQFGQSAVGKEFFALILWAGVLLCLFTPTSFRLIWIERPQDQGGKIRQGVQTHTEKIRAFTYGLVARLAGWKTDVKEAPGRTVSFGLLLRRLGMTCLLLLVWVGATYSWQQSYDGKSAIVNVIASVTWTLWALSLFAFVIVLLIVGYQSFPLRAYFKTPPNSKSAGANERK